MDKNGIIPYLNFNCDAKEGFNFDYPKELIIGNSRRYFTLSTAIAKTGLLRNLITKY